MGENISFKNVPFKTNKKKGNKKKSSNTSNKPSKKKENPHHLTFNERNGLSNDGNDGMKMKNTSAKKLKNKAKNDKFIENKKGNPQPQAKKGMKERKAKKSKKNHPERMRKSSFNAMRQKLAVFNDNDSHEEKYSDISRDVTPKPDEVIHGFEDGSDDDEDIVFDLDDLVDENKEPEKEVVVLDDEDEDDVYDPKNLLPTSEVVIEDSEEESKASDSNNLADNGDFIQFESEEEEEGQKESEEEDDTYNPQKLPITSEYPWMSLSKKLFKKESETDVSAQLNTEVSAFVKYISPSKEEILKRNKALTRLCDAVKQLWSDAELLPFGSYATDLYLPQSDIDCCVLSEFKNKNHKSCLYELSSFLKYKKLATNVEVIANARIPIIKFVESESGINFDVCFEQSGGITVAKMVSGWISEITGLRELVLVVKQFLSSRRLNNVRFGGIGGFSMVCLCYSFLKLHPKISAKCIDPLDNLGTLLIEFFELYGVHFNYEAVGISLREETFGYITKRSHPELTAPRGPRRGPPDTYTLVVENPLSPSENVTAGTFRLRWVTKAFFGAYQLLCEKCYELDKISKKNRLGISILSSIIKYKGIEREFSDEREEVQNEARLRVHKFVNDKLKKEQSEGFDTRMYHITDSEEEDEDLYVIPKPQANKKRTIESADKAEDPAPTKRQKVSELLGLD